VIKALTSIALVVLTVPAAASARIVPQRGIAGANLDMSQPEIRAKLGKPDRVRHPTSPIFGEYTTWHYGRTTVDMFRNGDGRVFNVTTTSRTQRTASGVGVGSSTSQVKRGVKRVRCNSRHCWVGRFEPGGKVTDFMLTGGRVTRVTIGYVID
jgi:hypothetical protein